MRCLLLVALLVTSGCGDPAAPTQAGLDTIAKAEALRAQLEIRQIRAEAEQYRALHGEWPWEGSPSWREPVDPWGRPYRFEVDGDRAIVVSAGADGELDTGDDVIAE